MTAAAPTLHFDGSIIDDEECTRPGAVGAGNGQVAPASTCNVPPLMARLLMVWSELICNIPP